MEMNIRILVCAEKPSPSLSRPGRWIMSGDGCVRACVRASLRDHRDERDRCPRSRGARAQRIRAGRGMHSRRGARGGMTRDRGETGGTYPVQDVRDVLEDRGELVWAHTCEHIAREVGLRCPGGGWLAARGLLVGGGAGGRELEGGVVGGLCRCHRFSEYL